MYASDTRYALAHTHMYSTWDYRVQTGDVHVGKRRSHQYTLARCASCHPMQSGPSTDPASHKYQGSQGGEDVIAGCSNLFIGPCATPPYDKNEAMSMNHTDALIRCTCSSAEV